MAICKCGCGEEIPDYRDFAYGHKKKAMNRDTDRKCACGCGQELSTDFTKKGEKRKWIRGHDKRGTVWSEERRKKVEEYWEQEEAIELASRAGTKSSPPDDWNGENHPNWKGGKVDYGAKRYVMVRAPNHPNAHRGYVYEHVYKASQVLGRPLEDGEEVHHINFNGKDNRNQNLMVCSREYHMFIHSRIKELGLEEKFRRKGRIDD